MNKIKFLIIILSLLAIGWYVKDNVHARPDRVDAVGALTFDFGSGLSDGDPIFDFSNIAPGFTDSHDVVANNGDTVPRQVGVKGLMTGGIGDLESQIEIVISEGVTPLYGTGSPTGAKTLSDLFTDSNTFNGVILSTVPNGEDRTYTFAVKFKEAAGNDFQDTSVVFDLKFGIVSEIPVACEEINFPNPAIFGTAGDDNIKGTNGNDLIFALEGNDTVNSGLGRDCVIGGLGNDRINTGVGRDILVGNEGNDTLSGGVDNDTLYGNEGDDDIDGGAGNDTVWAGAGNDKADGGAGNDIINGEDGDDMLKGGAGNDALTGGNDNDNVNGQAGRDGCEGETKVQCEVIL